MKFRRKLFFIFIGLIIGILVIEIIFQIAGFIVYYHQRQGYIEENRQFENHYRILALGESTTADLYNGQSSWPAELEKILNNKSKKIKFKVFNEGIPATTSIVILSKLQKNIEKYEPHMVVTMIGFNDPLYSAISYDDSSFFNVFKLPKFLRWVRFNFMKGSNLNEKSCPAEDMAKFQQAFTQAVNLIDSNDLENASTFVEQIGKNYPFCYAYCKIGHLYGKMGRKSRSDQRNYYQSKALDYFEMGKEYDKECKVQLIYYYLGKTSNITYYYMAENLIEEMGQYYPNDLIEIEGSVFGSLFSYLDEGNVNYSNLPEFISLYGYDKFNMNSKVSDKRNANINYVLIHKMIAKNEAKHAIMQYPRQDIGLLKKSFEGYENIIFISNQENFESALRTNSWDDIFVDIMSEGNHSRYGGKLFGHATLLGNRLIAENAAEVILNELNITS